MDEPGRDVQAQQTSHGFLRHRTDDIAADDDQVHVLLSHVREHGLECRQVAVDVVERRNPHYASVSGAVKQSS